MQSFRSVPFDSSQNVTNPEEIALSDEESDVQHSVDVRTTSEPATNPDEIDLDEPNEEDIEPIGIPSETKCDVAHSQAEPEAKQARLVDVNETVGKDCSGDSNSVS